MKSAIIFILTTLTLSPLYSSIDKPYLWLSTQTNRIQIGVGPVNNQSASVVASGGSLSSGNTYYYRIYPFTESNSSGWPSTEMIRVISQTGSKVDLAWDLLDGASYYRITRGTAQGSESGYFQTNNNNYSDTGSGFTAFGNAVGSEQNLLFDVSGSFTLPSGNGIGWTNPVTGTRNGSIAVTSSSEMEFQAGTANNIGRNPAYYFNKLDGSPGLVFSFNTVPSIWYWDQTAWEIRVATIQFSMRNQPTGSIVFNGPSTELLRLTTNTIVGSVPFINTGQPSFSSRINSHYFDITGDGRSHVVNFGTENWDNTNSFNGSTYTVPTSGKYYFCASVDLANILSTHTSKRVDIRRNGTIELTNYSDLSLASTNLTKSVCGTIALYKGDTVSVSVAVGGSSNTVDIELDPAGGFFQGHLEN